MTTSFPPLIYNNIYNNQRNFALLNIGRTPAGENAQHILIDVLLRFHYVLHILISITFILLFWFNSASSCQIFPDQSCSRLTPHKRAIPHLLTKTFQLFYSCRRCLQRTLILITSEKSTGSGIGP